MHVVIDFRASHATSMIPPDSAREMEVARRYVLDGRLSSPAGRFDIVKPRYRSTVYGSIWVNPVKVDPVWMPLLCAPASTAE